MLRTVFILALMLAGGWYALKSAFGALVFYICLAYFRPESWLWDSNWFQSLNVSLICGVYLVARSLLSPSFKYRVTVSNLLLIAFLVVSLLSTTSSRYYAFAWPWFVNFAKVITVAILMSGLVNDEKKSRVVLIAMVLALGFEGVKQGWVQLLLHPGGRNDNPITVLGDNNAVAVGMFMLLGPLVALMQSSTRVGEKWFYRLFAIGIAYRGLSTYSRGGFLAFGVMVIAYVIRTQYKIRTAVAALVLAAIILPVLPQAFWDRMNTIPTSQQEMTQSDDGSMQGRLHFWRVATRMANAHPLLGIGFNAYNAAYDDYDFLSGAFGRRRSVHSIWFGTLAEVGYTGLTLYVVLMITAIVLCGRTVRRAQKGLLPAEVGLYAIGVQIALLVFAVGGSFIPVQYSEPIWHFMGLSFALNGLTAAVTAPAAAAQRPAERVYRGFRPPATVRAV